MRHSLLCFGLLASLLPACGAASGLLDGIETDDASSSPDATKVARVTDGGREDARDASLDTGRDASVDTGRFDASGFDASMPSCPANEMFCDGQCTNVLLDQQNCGGCGLRCSEPCVGGRCVVKLVGDRDFPISIAVNDSDVYWLDQGGNGDPSGYIESVPIGGGSVATLATIPTTGTDMAIDTSNAYWAAYDYTSNTGVINSVPLGGGSVASLATLSDNGSVQAMAVTPAGVFWTQQNGNSAALPAAVVGLPLTGGPVTTLGPNRGSPISGIAVDATSIYWSEAGSSNVDILKMPIAGGMVTTLVTGNGSNYFRVEQGYLYWSNSSVGIQRVPTSGGTVETVAMDTNTLGAIAVDDVSVYWISAPEILKAPLAGGATTTITGGVFSGVDLAVNDSAVVWCTARMGGNVGGHIMSATPK